MGDYIHVYSRKTRGQIEYPVIFLKRRTWAMTTHKRLNSTSPSAFSLISSLNSSPFSLGFSHIHPRSFAVSTQPRTIWKLAKLLMIMKRNWPSFNYFHINFTFFILRLYHIHILGSWRFEVSCIFFFSG